MTLVDHSPLIMTVAINEDGNKVISGSGEIIKVWNLDTG